MNIADLDTPALLVDLDIMEANIARTAKTCRDAGINWRPHIKGQKTPEIVKKELAAGAIGATCAKLRPVVGAAAGVAVAAAVRMAKLARPVTTMAKTAKTANFGFSVQPQPALVQANHTA